MTCMKSDVCLHIGPMTPYRKFDSWAHCNTARDFEPFFAAIRASLRPLIAEEKTAKQDRGLLV